jgi:acyl-CoA thioester hydrolase
MMTPPPDRRVFAFTTAPTPGDIDENGHVNNIVYLRWVQDAATRHWRAQTDLDLQAKWAWVVTRHEIDYAKASFLGELLQVRTWVGEARGPRFDRFVQVIGPAGDLRTQARSDWVLIDAVRRTPVRVRPELVQLFCTPR